MGAEMALQGFDRTNALKVAKSVGNLLSKLEAVRDSSLHNAVGVSISNELLSPFFNLGVEQILISMAISILHDAILARKDDAFSVITFAHIDSMRCHLAHMSARFPTLRMCHAFFR